MKNSKLTPNRRAVMEGGDYTPVPNDLIRNREVPHTVLRVFSVLNSYDPSYPAMRTIRRVSGLGTGTIQKGIKWLEERGVIIRRPSSSRLKTNEYIVCTRDKWILPTGDSGKQVTDPDTDCIQSECSDVSTTDTSLCPSETPNNSNTKKSKLVKRKQKLNNDNSCAQHPPSNQRSNLPKHFILEAVDTYKNLFARHFNGQRFMKKYAEQFYDSEIQEKFVEQCVHFSKYGGTVYGRVENEFLRLINQKVSYPIQPRFLLNDASFASYQMALSKQVSKHTWPRLIYPYNGKYLKVTSFDDDPEAVLATKTLNRLRVYRDIRAFEKMRWEEQPDDVVQIGPYLFNYLIIKSYLHFGSISAPLNQFILAYEKATGLKLFRPNEEKTISGLNMKPRSLWSKIYCPQSKSKTKSENQSPKFSKTHTPINVLEYVSKSYQRLHGDSKEQASAGFTVINSVTHREASRGV